MKKNKAMRAAGTLFVATMLSTSIVSGTYAKYVTSDSGSDTARVAKFGVEVTANGSLFDKTYYAVGQTNGNQPGGNADANVLTVKSSNTDNVVAPGTQSDSNGLVFSISGTPEVDVKVEFKITNSFDTVGTGHATDIFLGTGTFPNMTNGNVWDDKYEATNDVFTVSGTPYYPIKWTLSESTDGTTFTPNSTYTDVTLETIETYLEGTGVSGTYKAGTDLSTVIGGTNSSTKYYKLTWKWDFGDETGVTKQDKEDTLLGDLAADFAGSTTGGDISATGSATGGIVGKAYNKISSATDYTDGLSALTRKNYSATTLTDTPAAGDYSINTDIVIEISVTQVD